MKITDTGIGIAPAFLPKVFDRFRQANASITRQHGGLGLGLAIVQSLVEAHGGQVRAYSEGEGTGATITFSLPVFDSPSRTVTKSVSLGMENGLKDFEPADLAGIRIVIVDDERDALELVARILEGCGAEVRLASTAEEGIDAVRNVRPDLIISDIGMPDTDGYTFLRKARALGVENGGSIPAIALTAFARPQDRIAALRAGFHLHLSKPLDAGELVASVAYVTGRQQP